MFTRNRPTSIVIFAAALVMPVCHGAAITAKASEPASIFVSDASPPRFLVSDHSPGPRMTSGGSAEPAHWYLSDGNHLIGRELLEVNFWQPAEVTDPEAETELTAPGEAETSLRDLSEQRRALASAPGSGVLLGSESVQLPTSDAGGFLGKSDSVTGVAFQTRNPIVTDIRSRGNHVYQTLGAGSYWIPARLDLDTMLSKLDPRIIDNMIVIKGPYSALYGPGFNYVDTQILPSPRSAGGPSSGGSSSLEYQTNGERIYGRQFMWRAAETYGVRVSYGHKTGNDYETGGAADGSFFQPESLPSSYNSRDFDVAIGVDLAPDRNLEFQYLRLDQTGMEYPGLVFDMRFLVTDSFEVKYEVVNQPAFDRLFINAWYNRTRFEGDDTGIGKRRQIPQLNPGLLNGPQTLPDPIARVTDVDALSTGFQAQSTWGHIDDPQLTLGVDLRYLDTELNDFDVAVNPNNNQLQFENFPVPPSNSANPGIFAEVVLPLGGQVKLKGGGRFDWVETDATDRTLERFVTNQTVALTSVSEELQADLPQEFALWSAFVTVENQRGPWTTFAGFGFAERPPNLTELYATGPFIGTTQPGLTFLFGDPLLSPERLAQVDAGLRLECSRFRGELSGFYAHIDEYITYDFRFDPNSILNQMNYVNTDLATLTGFELSGEVEVSPWLDAFGIASFVYGRDHSRLTPARVLLEPRSGFLTEKEPLPGIPPFESVVGLRLHAPCECRYWNVEFSARIVDNQDRVALSLDEFDTPGFTIFALRSYWQINDQLLFAAGVENFGDKFYREHLDYRPGRGVFQPGANAYFSTELTY